MKKIKRILVLCTSLFLIGCNNLVRDEGPKEVVHTHYSSNNVPSKNYKLSSNPDYFVFVNDTEKDVINTESEWSFLSFYKNKNAKGYGDSSPYWRWSVKYSKTQMNNAINTNLANLSRKKPKNVFKLVGGSWRSGVQGFNAVGDVKSLKVVKRGRSGVVMDLLITGSKGKYLVTKEGNVRSVLAFGKSSIKVGDVAVIGKYGKEIYKGNSRFPSPFYAIEATGSGFVVYGGGFGHGVGIPQYGVRDLTKLGYDYDDILERYYRETKLSRAGSIDGFDGKLRVGITKNSNPEHTRIVLSGEDTIVFKLSWWRRKRVKHGEKAVIVRKGNYIVVYKNGEEFFRTDKPNVLVYSDEKIQVDSITRAVSGRHPKYRGKFEIAKYGSSSLLLINIIKLEDYLKQVVGSEMPKSFGLEALKIQAVAARTYAVNAAVTSKYKKYNFDLVDTVASQVYNNKDEAEIVDKAIKKTKGKVLTHDGDIIPAFFYSTSGGYSSTPKEIW